MLLGFFGLVVAVGVGLIGWRGDRLRSPGTIDAAVSREGAFLVNNLLFAGFALVVLLGTVFPLFVEALNGQQVTVGRPYFDSMTLPIGFALLFFMAVAPALPWRKAGPGVLRRTAGDPGMGRRAVVIAICVLAGVRGFTPSGGLRPRRVRRRERVAPARARSRRVAQRRRRAPGGRSSVEPTAG